MGREVERGGRAGNFTLLRKLHRFVYCVSIGRRRRRLPVGSARGHIFSKKRLKYFVLHTMCDKGPPGIYRQVSFLLSLWMWPYKEKQLNVHTLICAFTDEHIERTMDDFRHVNSNASI